MELHVTKRKGREIVVLLDNDMRIVKPVYDYLKYQDQRDRAINTLIAYGNDLKAFWEFLSDYGYAYDEVSPKMIGEYKEYLMSEDDNIIAINKEGARTAKTINRMLSTLHGFYQYKADMQEIDNPLLMHEVNRPFNAFKGILEHASNAATKKITVDQTYENATKIKGKTKKGCVVKVKIGKKTYQSKVNKKGNYSVKVSKLKLGKKYTMTAYQKKKVYAKKSFYAETKNIKVNAFTENDHIFSGYAPSKAYIVLKCSGKSYTTTASVSGYWKIDTKKPLGRNRIEMKVYKKGKVIAKYWKEYQKESSVTDKNDDQNNAASAVHKHFYNIPVYKTVHFDEAGHYETIISSGSYYEKEVSHDICDTCVKDLTQEYINGIKDGTYKKVEIPKNDENTSSSKSRDILDDYKEIRWSNDMPLYEDFIAYGGWNHTCSDHKLTEQTETIMAYFPGAIRKDWIVDQKAHDEQVVIGYQCSCGDIHKVENN